MKQRKLGQNGPQISAVGYGAMSFTDFYGPADDAQSLRVLAACLDHGLTHIDTSNAYGMGRSENVIGQWLKNRSGEMPFSIATKVGITRDPEHRFNNSKEHLTTSLDDSLRRLGVEAIDLYYVHRRDTRHDIEDVTETMAGFVKQGKIKAIGYSEISPASLRRAHAVHPIAAVQSEYSLSTRAPELGLLPLCEEIGATLVAFSPVGRSLLTDRPHSADTAQTMPFLKQNPRFCAPNLQYNLEYNKRFRALAADLGVSAATLAIAWVIHQSDQIIAIPGTRNLHHLSEVAHGGSFDLTPEMERQIEEVLPVGWAHGDRYSVGQWNGPERYC